MVAAVKSPSTSRRAVCTGLALLPLSWSCARSRATDRASATPLRLRPPELSNPRRLVVTEALIAREGELNLGGEPADWIIELPRGRYLEAPLHLHGRNQARHIVIIGGGIRPAARFDPVTMRLIDGSDWAAYAYRGFDGAHGGSFRLQVQERSYIRGLPPRKTRPLAWNAKPDQIKAALEEVCGKGSVLAVDGPASPGGPWKIVPSPLPRLGRPVLDIQGLKGTVEPIARNVFAAAQDGLVLKQWHGTAHCEGLHIHGDWTNDGIDVQNYLGGAVAQFANVHSAPAFHLFHDDWSHPDGAQFYLGPSVARMENVDLVSLGGNGFIAQPVKARAPHALERLEPWWMRNCHFRAIVDDRRGREADASTACFQEIDPRLGPAFDQPWDCKEVYCSRVRASDGRAVHRDPSEKYHFYRGRQRVEMLLDRIPDGVFFADPGAGKSGPDYVSPGYTNKAEWN